MCFCGGSGIRTPVTVPRKAVFKTAAFDRSAKPPIRLNNSHKELVEENNENINNKNSSNINNENVNNENVNNENVNNENVNVNNENLNNSLDKV